MTAIRIGVTTHQLGPHFDFRHTVSVGQVVGNLQVLFVSSFSHIFFLRFLERPHQLRLIFIRHDSINHWKQAVILFLYVVSEQPYIVVCVLYELSNRNRVTLRSIR